MKLYKYVSMNTAVQIVRSNTIGFSRPEYFNDPFDGPFAIPVPTSNVIEGLFAQIGAQGKSIILSKNTAILSMTRTPTSPLMWAHYADSHSGAVIGIDASVAGFLDVASNMIPAHYGSVVYSRQRNGGPYHSAFSEPVTVGATYHFVLSHYEKWQRLFLTKPMDWAYEEEVRVVKCIRGLSGEVCQNKSGLFSIITINGRELHAFHLPERSITEVYIGVRAPSDQVANMRMHRPDLAVYRCGVNPHAYAITTKENAD
jgi:Protein of unknown function (DUF2971)